ncbi:WG repeat-containing protein [Paenibacillus sp. IHBB 3054]|uniref:WG repeat-containing protein n=1 Tax=Paenibacillus sp. IHBB 3054 TaxID=3425689 RepID=UPI003F67A8EF
MFKRIGMALLTLSLTTAIAGTGWAAPSPAQIDVSQTSFDFDTAKPNSDAEFHHGLLLAVQADGDLVYYDRTGKQAFILPEGIVPVTDFAEQRAVVKDSATGRYGYINTKGIVAIPCQYASAGNLSGGVAHVVLAEGAGEALIDRAGKVVTTLTEKYSSEFYFSDGLALAYAPKDGKIGFINTSGKLVIPYQYTEARGYSQGLALVKNSAGLYGYINTAGKTVIPFKYKEGSDFSEGLASVKNAKGKWGFINKQGELSLPYQYENTGDFSEGLASVYNPAGKVGFINKQGKLVIGYQKYNRAFSFKEGIALVGISNPADNSKDKYGYINTKGELLTKLIYTGESSSFSGGYAVGMTAQGTGYILTKQGLAK